MQVLYSPTTSTSGVGRARARSLSNKRRAPHAPGEANSGRLTGADILKGDCQRLLDFPER